jgi:hypothetical protein
MSNKSAIAACLVQCPFLGQPDSADNGGNWAQSGHEKGYAANVSKWVVFGQSAFYKYSGKAALQLSYQQTS